ncbi:MAG: hypothetical protein KAI95_19595 [Bacteroidales bacterium]|nr:hypothetical protein [Bacteroidales bacterium]
MASTNIDMLQIVANGLEEIKDDLVFVGGAVAELYASDPASSDIRPTTDIDCLIELKSRLEYSKLEERLRAKGFVNDTSMGAPICRWIYKNIKVDVMPTDEKILGFSNQWYLEGIENKIGIALPDGIEIFIFLPQYYLGAKFEALKNRGGNDLRQSHDFEDLIYILDNCPDLLNDISKSNVRIREYLKNECQNLLNNIAVREGIESALPYGSGDERVEIIEDLINDIAKIE